MLSFITYILLHFFSSINRMYFTLISSDKPEQSLLTALLTCISSFILMHYESCLYMLMHVPPIFNNEINLLLIKICLPCQNSYTVYVTTKKNYYLIFLGYSISLLSHSYYKGVIVHDEIVQWLTLFRIILILS